MQRQYRSDYFEGVRSEIELRQEVFALFCDGLKPPRELAVKDLEDKVCELQDWLGEHLSIGWVTHITIIDAVDSIVEEAIDNGNIRLDRLEIGRTG